MQCNVNPNCTTALKPVQMSSIQRQSLGTWINNHRNDISKNQQVKVQLVSPIPVCSKYRIKGGNNPLLTAIQK